MIKVKIFLLIALLIVPLITFAEDPEFSLTIIPNECDPILNMSIINKSKSPLLIMNRDLPWSMAMNNFELHIQNLKTKRIRQRTIPIDDSEGFLTIKPGENITKQENLKSIFPDSDFDLVKSSHLLFWHYLFEHNGKIIINHGSNLIEKCD